VEREDQAQAETRSEDKTEIPQGDTCAEHDEVNRMENKTGIAMKIKDERTLVLIVAIAVVFAICAMIFTIEMTMIAKGIDGQVAGIVVGAFIAIVSGIVTVVTCYFKFFRKEMKK
jgi:hypothetical protein